MDLLSLSDEDYNALMQVEWKPNAKRGCSYVFGYKVIKEFLDKVSKLNNIARNLTVYLL